jgi:hypothetical protein
MVDTPKHPDYTGDDADGQRHPDPGRPGDPNRPSPRKPSQGGYGHDSGEATREEADKFEEGRRPGGFEEEGKR